MASEFSRKLSLLRRERGVSQRTAAGDLGVSQADHPEIFAQVPSEGEGIKSVKATAAYLKEKGLWKWIPYLIMQSGFKYIGYLLGKKYHKLPEKCIMKLTKKIHGAIYG